MIHLRAILTPSEAKQIILADLQLSRLENQETKDEHKRKRSEHFKRTGETQE